MLLNCQLGDKGNNKRKRQNRNGDTVILYLARQGADVNNKDKYGLTPLHYAAMRGNEKGVGELLDSKGIDIEVRVLKFNSMFETAA